MMIEILKERAHQSRTRAAVRAWEFRQRNNAKGTWFLVRRLLARASAAYALSERAAAHLSEKGFVRDPLGAKLYPPKAIFVVPRSEVDELPDVVPIPVRLGPEFLLAPMVLLVAFP